MNRYDYRTRLVFHFAREESSDLYHSAVDPEHFLLGLIREGGLAGQLLESMGLSLQKARSFFELKLGRGEEGSAAPTPNISALARQMIQVAGNEAKRHGANGISTGHMLIALASDPTGISYELLDSLEGGTRGVIRRTLEAMRKAGEPVDESALMDGAPSATKPELDPSMTLEVGADEIMEQANLASATRDPEPVASPQSFEDNEPVIVDIEVAETPEVSVNAESAPQTNTSTEPSVTTTDARAAEPQPPETSTSVILVPVAPQNSNALASQFRLSTTLESHMVLEYARLEALRSGSDAFDARHLLLGVLALGERAAGLLHGMGMTLEGTRRDFKLRPERPPAVGPLMSGEIVEVLERTKETVSDGVLRDIDVLEALTVVNNSARPVLERYDVEHLRRSLRAMRGRHLIAMGGGGFSQEPDNLKLDEFIVQLARDARSTNRPRVRFVSTAAGDSPEYIERFYKAFRTLDCEPSHLALFRPDQWDEELRDMILDADVLYFSGGSTRNALALWREWDVLEDFRRAYQRGTVIAGLSAGAVAWFEQAHSDSVGRQPAVLEGLGWLPGSFTPHYSNEANRRESLHNFIKDGRIKPGYAADDGAALYFVNESLERVVTSRDDAKAYRINLHEGEAREEVVQLEAVGAT